MIKLPIFSTQFGLFIKSFDFYNTLKYAVSLVSAPVQARAASDSEYMAPDTIRLSGGRICITIKTFVVAGLGVPADIQALRTTAEFALISGPAFATG